MPEEILEIVQVRACQTLVGRKGVPQIMKAEVRDPRISPRCLEGAGDVVQTAPLHAWEDVTVQRLDLVFSSSPENTLESLSQ